jgi:SecD/SecF fusion protein
VLIALAHDVLITAGVYSLTGREVTTATVAALLTILGYSLYDTIIVFDRVRENIPRMPRAAFSQIVNRSMSEVLTRSLATTFCTLMPIVALLLFGGVAGSTELQDFAFALLIGVASGAYSSIFIASPVLTHWKEREPQYRSRHLRIEAEQGFVPAYAAVGTDVEPERKGPRRTGRLTSPDPDTVSAAEFEQMKRDLEIEQEAGAHTSTLTKRLARTKPEPAPPPSRRKRAGAGPATPAPQTPAVQPRSDGDAAPATPQPDGGTQPFTPAPDVPENEGMAPVPPKPKRASKPRNRRHGRRR